MFVSFLIRALVSGVPRDGNALYADDKPHAGLGCPTPASPLPRVSGRRLRFSGHPTDVALPSNQAPSPPSAEFKSLTAFLKRSICPASTSVLPWTASRLSIMASNNSASSLGKPTSPLQGRLQPGCNFWR